MAVGIRSIFRSTHFSGNQATELNFKKYADKAGIIHLALHGSSSAKDPYLSGIQFPNQNTDKEDGFLHYYEIMNQPLQARIAVLSACETAHGYEYAGEGMYHIARGFSYAGCPTLVATLWKIDDQSTTKIISGFYEQIATGKDIDQSLMSSKLAYLEQADELTSDPRIWAGIVTIGDTNPINEVSNNIWLLGFESIFIITVLFVLFKIYRDTQLSYLL